jgi:uncharacterized protein
MNASTVMDFYAATADALQRWEPRIQVTSVKASMQEPGAVLIDLDGIYLPDGRNITLEGIEVR